MLPRTVDPCGPLRRPRPPYPLAMEVLEIIDCYLRGSGGRCVWRDTERHKPLHH